MSTVTYVYADIIDGKRASTWASVELDEATAVVGGQALEDAFAAAVVPRLRDTPGSHRGRFERDGQLTFVYAPRRNSGTGVSILDLRFITVKRSEVTWTPGIS